MSKFLTGCPFGHESLLRRPIEGEVYCHICNERYNNTVCRWEEE